jgi:hypothetical protein
MALLCLIYGHARKLTAENGYVALRPRRTCLLGLPEGFPNVMWGKPSTEGEIMRQEFTSFSESRIAATERRVGPAVRYEIG